MGDDAEDNDDGDQQEQDDVNDETDAVNETLRKVNSRWMKYFRNILRIVPKWWGQCNQAKGIWYLTCIEVR